MKGIIHYRQATIRDKGKIISFYKKAHPTNFKIRSSGQWDWQYEKNPFNNEKLSIWLAIDESTNTIVGHTGVIYEDFKLGPKNILIGWGIDLGVLPEYRGRKIAFKLQEYMMTQVDAYMNISMAYSTRLISNKLGAIESSNVVQYVKPLFVPAKRMHHLRLLRSYKNNHLINKIKRRLLKQQWFKNLFYYSGIDSICSVYYQKKCRLVNDCQDDKFVFKKLLENDSLVVIDIIWNKLTNAYDKLAVRNSAYFKWKYFNQPHKSHICHVIYEEEEPVGYVVLRGGEPNESNVGIMVDYFFAPERTDIFEAILKFADNKFKKSKREFIYIVSSIPQFDEYLCNFGFAKTRVHTPTFLTSIKELKEYLIGGCPNKWFLTFTDHELDRYPMRGK